VALVSGAIADRAKFSGWVVFTVVGHPGLLPGRALGVRLRRPRTGQSSGGFIANTIKAIDFAGGTAIHINAGAAALALAWWSASGTASASEPMRPHNLTLVMLGAGLLWFGWFGFNAGSALAAGTTAASPGSTRWPPPPPRARLAGGGAGPRRPRRPRWARRRASSRAWSAITPAAPRSAPLGAIAIGILAGASAPSPSA
jgi:Amt family ammonium transporter